MLAFMGDGTERRYGLGLRRDGHIILVTALTTLLLAITASGIWEIVSIAQWFSDMAAFQARHMALYQHPGLKPRRDNFVPYRMAYPPIAIVRGEQGAVLLNLLILPSGAVGDATVVKSSGSAQLDSASITQVGYWRFVPAVKDGQPVAAHKQYRIVWKLANDSNAIPIGRMNLPDRR
jgi:TonB family protein